MQQWHNELAETLSLNGVWDFSLAGEKGAISVPGTWEAQDYPRYVDGPAVYRKTIHVPAAWQGRRVQLQFDAVSYHVEIEVNGIAAGDHSGMWTPFALDVSEALHFGADNDLQLTIFKPGERFRRREALAGFLPEVCLPFGGGGGGARLVAFEGAAVEDFWLLPDAEMGVVQVNFTTQHGSGLKAQIVISDPEGNEASVWEGQADAGRVSLPVEPIQRWRPDSPLLYTVEIRLLAGDTVRAVCRKTFGFRALTTAGEKLYFNGDTVFLRGVLNWGWYPDIFCPAPDEVTIRDEFRRVRALGYNMVKLCLYVPSPLYFEIADEEGMLLWLELPMWLPKVTERLRQQAPLEYADIFARVHHHPSIVIYSLGCELNAAADGDLLSSLNALARRRVSGALLCDNSGSGEAYGGLGYDYADFNDYHFYADLHNFSPLVDHFRRDWREPRPWIFGEFCDADDYRDLNQIAAGMGGSLPWWLVEKNPLHPLTFIAYAEQPERMAKLDLSPFDHDGIQWVSRQQSLVVRKVILEKVRARAGMGGYVVTSIRDTPLATSSMFDDLGREKYPAEEFSRFNSDSVLILEGGRRRTWRNGGDRIAPLDRHCHVSGGMLDFRIVLAHVGRDLPGRDLRWRLTDANNTMIASDTLSTDALAADGMPHELAHIYLTAPTVDSAQQFTLEVQLAHVTENRWPIWIFPEVKEWSRALAVHDPFGGLSTYEDLLATEGLVFSADPAEWAGRVLVTTAYSPQVGDFVRAGGEALVIQNGPGGMPGAYGPFWREAIKLLYRHPVMDHFPHQDYTDVQFYHLASDYALDSARFVAETADVRLVFPLIKRLDARHFTELDYLVDFRIGAGRMVASTLRFAGGMGDQAAGLRWNPAGRWLLHRLLTWLHS